MTKLEQLIGQLCPNGVEFKKVKEVFKRLKGTPITAGKMKEIEDPDGEIRIFAGGKTVINAKEFDIPNANITRVPAVLVQSRGVIDVIFYEKPFTFKNEMWAYTADNRITVKYLYYVLKNNIQDFREAASGMGALPQISLPVTEEFLIPMPPLPVQNEIVRILDNFTELTARKAQYAYYQDKLLTRSAGTIHTLGECCMSIADGDHQPPPKADSGVPFITISNFTENGIDFTDTKFVPQEYYDKLDKKRRAQKDDILYSVVGSFGIPVHITEDKPFVFQRHIAILRPNVEMIAPRYLYHVMKSDAFYKKADAAAIGAAQRTISLSALNRMKISIPSLEMQERLVRVGNVKKCAVGKHPKSEKLGSAGQAACCACTHSRYFTGGSPSGLRV